MCSYVFLVFSFLLSLHNHKHKNKNKNKKKEKADQSLTQLYSDDGAYNGSFRRVSIDEFVFDLSDTV